MTDHDNRPLRAVFFAVGFLKGIAAGKFLPKDQAEVALNIANELTECFNPSPKGEPDR